MNEMHKRIKHLDDEKQLLVIEAYKNSSKCVQAMRELKDKKPKKQLIVQQEDGSIAASEKNQIKITTFHQSIHFRRAWKMIIPFTKAEIQKSSKSMTNQQSIGQDGLNAEFVKHRPSEMKSKGEF